MLTFLLAVMVIGVGCILLINNNQKDLRKIQTKAADIKTKAKDVLDVNNDGKVTLADVKEEVAIVKKKRAKKQK